MPLTLTNLVGLEFDHPAFPWRLTLMLETCLSFAAAGVGHGLLSLAGTPLYWSSLANEARNNLTSHSIAVMILINAVGAWRSFSSRVSRDYRLHFGNKPSTSRLLLLELLRLCGFFCSRRFFSKRSNIFSAPLRFFAPRPSVYLFGLHSALVFWCVFRYMPEITPISSHSFTISKIIARLIGVTFQVSMDVWKERIAGALLTPVSLHGPDTRAMYRYAPMVTPRTIRLLRIECRQKPLSVSCELENVKLDDAPPFWAVSYQWGSVEKPQLLRLGYRDSPDIGHIPVTSNCAAAIQALIPKKVRYLWIDAICINQCDILEKKLQIPLMGEIYSQASLVTGYLGTNSELSVGTLVHRMIQTLADGKKFAIDSGGSFLIYRALSEIFQHDYFQRAWIVQEIALAKSLILIHGKDCLYLDQLITIAKAQSKDKFIPEGPSGLGLQEWMIEKRNVLGISKTQEWTHFTMSCFTFKERALVIEKLRLSAEEKDKSQRLTVAQIVDQNLLLSAGNPRDQVYALLSLASDSTVQELQPNYSLDVSNKEIFTDISWYYLREGRRLNLFLSAGTWPRYTSSESPRTSGLPSWVYDFAGGPAAHSFRLGNWAADVDRNRPVQLKCSLFPEYLSICGTRIEKVAFVASQRIRPTEFSWAVDYVAAMSDSMPKAILSIIDETQELVQNNVTDPYPGELRRQEAYWRTMLMDCFCNQTPAPHEAEDFFVTMNAWIREYLSDPEPAHWIHGHQGALALAKLYPGWSHERIISGINSVTEIISSIWMPYTFIILESGHMGWAPHDVQAGDLFCLFDGSIVPFVLRPTEGEDTFSLLGDGYVHGFMPGQEPGVERRPEECFKLV